MLKVVKITHVDYPRKVINLQQTAKEKQLLNALLIFVEGPFGL